MKKFYKENRVFVILMCVAIVCLSIIVGLSAYYIINSTNSSVYGNRLDGISDVVITNDKIADMEKNILDMKNILGTKIYLHGKIINFTAEFEKNVSNEQMKNVAIKCLDFFEEEYKNYYDIQFIFTKDTDEDENNIPILGYLKAGNSSISWINITN